MLLSQNYRGAPPAPVGAVLKYLRLARRNEEAAYLERNAAISTVLASN